jgi:hypothetical protein
MRKKRREPSDLFAAVNRNLMNYPLARDARITTAWRPSQPSKKYQVCDLPGSDRVRLRLNADANPSLRRCPTGFDINVLLLLLTRARMSKEPVIHWRSRAEVLATLGISTINSRERRRLAASLEYWAAISIHFPRWYAGAKQGYHIKNLLPPPIRRITSKNGETQITLAGQWTGLIRRRFVNVPLPLPQQAAAQNLVLWLLVAYAEPSKLNPLDEEQTVNWRQVPELRLSIGLLDRRVSRFSHAIQLARNWFEHHRGTLSSVIEDGRIRFYFRRPKKPGLRYQTVEEGELIREEERRKKRREQYIEQKFQDLEQRSINRRKDWQQQRRIKRRQEQRLTSLTRDDWRVSRETD